MLLMSGLEPDMETYIDVISAKRRHLHLSSQLNRFGYTGFCLRPKAPGLVERARTCAHFSTTTELKIPATVSRVHLLVTGMLWREQLRRASPQHN